MNWSLSWQTKVISCKFYNINGARIFLKCFSELQGYLTCFILFALLFISPVNTNNAGVADLLDRLAVAEENISDLTGSARTACETLDYVGSPIIDCCISDKSDQGPFICVPRDTAITVGIDIVGPCKVCPDFSLP